MIRKAESVDTLNSAFNLKERNNKNRKLFSLSSQIKIDKRFTGNVNKSVKKIDKDYEEITPLQVGSNNHNSKEKYKMTCHLCGSIEASVKCDRCNFQYFCQPCDVMYHRHPKRCMHIRKTVNTAISRDPLKPPIPPKVTEGAMSPPPQPPPRRNKRSAMFNSLEKIEQQSSGGRGIRRSSAGGELLCSRPHQNNASNGIEEIKRPLNPHIINRPLPSIPDNNRGQLPKADSVGNLCPVKSAHINQQRISQPLTVGSMPNDTNMSTPSVSGRNSECSTVPLTGRNLGYPRKFSLQQLPYAGKDDKASFIEQTPGNTTWESPPPKIPQKMRSQSISEEQWSRNILDQTQNQNTKAYLGSGAGSEMGDFQHMHRYNTMGYGGGSFPPNNRMSSSASVSNLNTTQGRGQFQQMNMVPYDSNMMWMSCPHCHPNHRYPSYLENNGIKRAASNVSMNLSSMASDNSGYPWSIPPHVHPHMPMYPGYFPSCQQQIHHSSMRGSATSIPDSMQSISKGYFSPSASVISANTPQRPINSYNKNRKARSRCHSRTQSIDSNDSLSSLESGDKIEARKLPIKPKSGCLSWQCHHCTFINPGHIDICGMCSKPSLVQDDRFSSSNDRQHKDKRFFRGNSKDNKARLLDYERKGARSVRDFAPQSSKMRSSRSLRGWSSSKNSIGGNNTGSDSPSLSDSPFEDSKFKIEQQLKSLNLAPGHRSRHYDGVPAKFRQRTRENPWKSEGKGKYRNRSKSASVRTKPSGKFSAGMALSLTSSDSNEDIRYHSNSYSPDEIEEKRISSMEESIMASILLNKKNILSVPRNNENYDSSEDESPSKLIEDEILTNISKKIDLSHESKIQANTIEIKPESPKSRNCIDKTNIPNKQSPWENSDIINNKNDRDMILRNKLINDQSVSPTNRKEYLSEYKYNTTNNAEIDDTIEYIDASSGNESYENRDPVLQIKVITPRNHNGSNGKDNTAIDLSKQTKVSTKENTQKSIQSNCSKVSTSENNYNTNMIKCSVDPLLSSATSRMSPTSMSSSDIQFYSPPVSPIQALGGSSNESMDRGFEAVSARIQIQISKEKEKSVTASDLNKNETSNRQLTVKEIVDQKMQEKRREQGLQIVQYFRLAERKGYNPEEVSLAMSFCEDANPVDWLDENWNAMIDTVKTLATNYGIDRTPNDVGNISVSESKEALRLHKGNIWAAVTECVEQRKKKYKDIHGRGNFSPNDIVRALEFAGGNVAEAILGLGKLGTFFKSIWNSSTGESGKQKDGITSEENIEKFPIDALHADDLIGKIRNIENITSEKSLISDDGLAEKVPKQIIYDENIESASSTKDDILTKNEEVCILENITHSENISELKTKENIVDKYTPIPKLLETEKHKYDSQSTNDNIPSDNITTGNLNLSLNKTTKLVEDIKIQTQTLKKSSKIDIPEDKTLSTKTATEYVPNNVDIEERESAESTPVVDANKVREHGGLVTVQKATSIVRLAITKAMARESAVKDENHDLPLSNTSSSSSLAADIEEGSFNRSSSENSIDSEIIPLGGNKLEPQKLNPIEQSQSEIKRVRRSSIPPAVESFAGPIFIPTEIYPKESSESLEESTIISAAAREGEIMKNDDKSAAIRVSSTRTKYLNKQDKTDSKYEKKLEDIHRHKQIESVKSNKCSQSQKNSEGTSANKHQNTNKTPIEHKNQNEHKIQNENVPKIQNEEKSIVQTDNKPQTEHKVDNKKSSSEYISGIENIVVPKKKIDKFTEKPNSRILNSSSNDIEPLKSDVEPEKSLNALIIDKRNAKSGGSTMESPELSDENTVDTGESEPDTETSDESDDVQEINKDTSNLKEEIINETLSESSESTNSAVLETPEIVVEKSSEEEATIELTSNEKQKLEQLNFDRTVRRLLAEGHLPTYEKAELAAQLLGLSFDEGDSFSAANECNSIYSAIRFLRQECELCAEKYPMVKMVSMLHCIHRCCYQCATNYFTYQIKAKNIRELRCPFCNEPDLESNEEVAMEYFNNLDILLKGIIDVETHELFQRKVRDLTLMKDPNFRWCNKCSSGYIANPRARKLICPDCQEITCAHCRQVWEPQHEGIMCDEFNKWKADNDPESQAKGVAIHLAENGITCPNCRFTYALAKGGCMHFTCTECKFEFCSGCSQPFKQGAKCTVGQYCERLGLHAHHPRNCLFYLRDKDPDQLQQLLTEHEIKFDTENPFSDDNDIKMSCIVQEQKETASGLRDDACGRTVIKGHAGLCNLHYVEYLVEMVNQHALDPVNIFDEADLRVCLRRNGKTVPVRRWESAKLYRNKLIKLIKEQLPLS